MAYALVLMVAYDRFVRRYEEPKLERMFGASYEEYRRRVPRWVPRLRPGDDDPAQTQLLHPSGAEARRDRAPGAPGMIRRQRHVERGASNVLAGSHPASSCSA
jgi:hypothetical protein